MSHRPGYQTAYHRARHAAGRCVRCPATSTTNPRTGRPFWRCRACRLEAVARALRQKDGTMAKKERALLGKPAPRQPGAEFKVKGQPLVCSECQTVWTESSLQAWQKCPFKDCSGQLQRKDPPKPGASPRPAKDRSTPLLDGL